MSLIYQNDVGAKIVARTKHTTLPPTATFLMMVTKPSGATSAWAVGADLNTGEMVHTSLSGDLNEVGEYQIQILATYFGIGDEASNAGSFVVYKKIY